MGVAQKTGTKMEPLGSGNIHQNLRNPSWLILSHIHILSVTHVARDEPHSDVAKDEHNLQNKPRTILPARLWQSYFTCQLLLPNFRAVLHLSTFPCQLLGVLLPCEAHVCENRFRAKILLCRFVRKGNLSQPGFPDMSFLFRLFPPFGHSTHKLQKRKQSGKRPFHTKRKVPSRKARKTDTHTAAQVRAEVLREAPLAAPARTIATSKQTARRYDCGSKPMESHLGVGAPPISVYFCGDWDVHWGYRVLTHSHMD